MANNKTTTKLTTKKKSITTVSEHGRMYVTATFNNTLITITDDKGNTVSWSSSGSSGFKGARKSTPFAASSAVENAAKKQLIQSAAALWTCGPCTGHASAVTGE